MSVSVHHDISLVMRMRHDKGAPQGPEGGRERRRRPGPSTAPQSTQDPRPHIYKNCLHPRRRMKAPNWALTAKRHEPQRIRGKGQPNMPEADHVSVTRDWPKCPRTPSPPHDKGPSHLGPQPPRKQADNHGQLFNQQGRPDENWWKCKKNMKM